MPNSFIKAEKVVATALGLLVRETTLPQLVWRDAVGDFAGAKNDTITIRLPAYAVAQSRVLRAGSARTKGTLNENTVPVKLDTDVYVDIPVTDEQLSLDIADFGAQVLNPVVQAMGLKIEDLLLGVMTGATYQTTIAHSSATDDPYDTAVDARTALNNARVPMSGRFIVTGTDLESEFLKSDRFVRANESGSTQTLREALIGRVAGFDVYTSPALAPDEAYAAHKTAYALVNRAPVVPAGAPWGAVSAYGGNAIRTVRVFDADNVEDRFIADSWMGATVVKDKGHIDADGRFVPAAGIVADGTAIVDNTTDAPRLVRAVKIAVGA